MVEAHIVGCLQLHVLLVSTCHNHSHSIGPHEKTSARETIIVYH